MKVPPLLAVLILVALPASASGIKFREVSKSWGIDFRHHNAATGQWFMPESVGGGVVMFDFDGDGNQDLFFVDAGPLPGYAGEAPRSRLFRNDGNGHFTDWTEKSGIKLAYYGSGGAAADIDGDGDLDLFVTGFGGVQLFRNNGDGTFTDVTKQSGIVDPYWSSSAAFADVDNDGNLDLLVANYVDFSLTNNPVCTASGHRVRGYCHPDIYHGQPVLLFRNKGNGTFEDVSRAAGLAGIAGPGLAVCFGDVDNDGWQDFYVANDNKPNFLLHNKGNGTFEDISVLSGTAIGEPGHPEAGMGIDMGDYDGDGLLDIVVTNYELETNGLYRNLGGATFVDSRWPAGIAEPSLLYLAFGVAFADFDQDGDLDLVIADGNINPNAAELLEGSTYAQRNLVFENLGQGKFREDKATGMDGVRVHRGLAVGDLDGDGDLDVALNDLNGPCEVYENISAGGHWLQVDLAAPRGNRFGIGARVELEAAGLKKQIRDVKAGSSYASQNALAVHFGLGKAATADRLTIRRPGRVQVFEKVPADRRIVVE
ncbi:MAG TPA: CRTAC1 family protein [Thermoanaerobaculia bacterium]